MCKYVHVHVPPFCRQDQEAKCNYPTFKNMCCWVLQLAVFALSFLAGIVYCTYKDEPPQLSPSSPDSTTETTMSSTDNNVKMIELFFIVAVMYARENQQLECTFQSRSVQHCMLQHTNLVYIHEICWPGTRIMRYIRRTTERQMSGIQHTLAVDIVYTYIAASVVSMYVHVLNYIGMYIHTYKKRKHKCKHKHCTC